MRFWAATAVAFVAIFAVSGCNDYGNTFQGNTGAFLQFVSPSSANACVASSSTTCNALTITLTGNGFVAQTYVTWDQNKIATTVTTDTATGSVISVTASIPAADLTKPGTHFIQTVNPHSGSGYNGLSNPVSFVINPTPNPVPQISSISPTSAPACGTSCATASIALTITGSNFLPTSSTTGVSQVNFNMGTTQATFSTANGNPANLNISATQIQLTIPGQVVVNNQTIPLFSSAGNAVVTVFNPPLTQTCQTGVNCNGNGGGGTSTCPLVPGSTTVTVCTLTITDPPASTAANAITAEEETPAVSSDGRYVAFSGSQDGHVQIFARDTCQGADSSCHQRTILVSSTTADDAATEDSHAPSMSSDGRFVAFSSIAQDLTSDFVSLNLTGRQVYLRDTCFGVASSCTPATQLISTDPNGALVGTEAILPSVSASGRFVAFLAVTPTHSKTAASPAHKSASNAPNSGLRQVFVRDTCFGAKDCTPATTRISLQPGDGSNTSNKPAGPALSGDSDHLALSGARTSTVFTHSVPVDDNVFLALTKSQK